MHLKYSFLHRPEHDDVMHHDITRLSHTVCPTDRLLLLGDGLRRLKKKDVRGRLQRNTLGPVPLPKSQEQHLALWVTLEALHWPSSIVARGAR